MSNELPKNYDPLKVEHDIYEAWQQAGAFNAEPSAEGEAYCIVIPPPNVTAPLHLGHALNNTLQDILIRYKRMRQFNTLWMPGTDHAGIATQTVVEKRILTEEGKRRTDFKRDEFVAKIQAWKDEYEARITEQLKLIGCSCDWRRQRFTMDDVCAKAVRETFFRLFRDGLIYRGKRLVNWDPATQTVLADDEVEYEDVHGHFWYMRYPLVNGTSGVSPEDMLQKINTGGTPVLPEYITVATTRPETMLGDTAVAMNPADPRAKFLVGKMVKLPIVGRIIPIIADEHVVLPDPDSDDEKARFSTGFLKVTPAHDPDDYQIGLRHDLPQINVMAPDGSISDRHGWDDAKTPEAQNLVGMDRFEAREAVVEFFRQENLLEEVREYVHSVGHSYRSHVPIEPYLSDQWYIAVKKPIPNCEPRIANRELMDDKGFLKGTDVPANSLAGFALAPLMDGRLKFTPDRYAKTYQTWLENLRDWPISRQLWWGHRIPVWKRRGTDQEISGTLTKDTAYDGTSMNICGVSVACQTGWEDGQEYWFYCPPPEHPEVEKELERLGFVRDADVLDTWFSSALWPFSTMGWPNETPELKKYYPGDVLCTAREIITLWVSRMVMMGQYCVGDIPFSDVFIHAMIQDGQGRKMSKSLGNGIDPLDIIDSHGADAMRFTLASMTTQTQDVRMPVEKLRLPDGREANTSPKFDIGRNFCNKLWNAARFAMMNLQATPPWCDINPTSALADTWISSRLQQTIRDATTAIENFRFNELADLIYHFMWDDLCDWYLEIAKGRINAGEQAPKAILANVLDILLRLLHPVCPFVTEAIWQKLNEIVPSRGPGDEPAEPMLIRANWPKANARLIDKAAEQRFALVQDLIRQVRNARTEHNVPPSTKVQLLAVAPGELADLLSDNTELIRLLTNAGKLEISGETVEPPADAAAITSGGVKMYVAGIIDRKAELARLTKQAETLARGIKGIEGKLGSEGFVAKAPADVVQRERQRLEKLQTELSAVEDALKKLQS